MGTKESYPAVVAGAGPGLGAALCRRLAKAGYQVVGLARSAQTLEAVDEVVSAAGGAMTALSCDLAQPEAVSETFAKLTHDYGTPAVVIYNAGQFLMRAFGETTPEEFRTQWETNALGAFLCAREAAPAMVRAGGGTIIFTGATASVKPAARFAAFGAAKFALRGMAQALARELGPQGVHVAHVVIDGVIWTPKTRQMEGVTQHNTLDADTIAESYIHLIRQDPSAWTHELDLRPSQEPF